MPWRDDGPPGFNWPTSLEQYALMNTADKGKDTRARKKAIALFIAAQAAQPAVSPSAAPNPDEEDGNESEEDNPVPTTPRPKKTTPARPKTTTPAKATTTSGKRHTSGSGLRNARASRPPVPPPPKRLMSDQSAEDDDVSDVAPRKKVRFDAKKAKSKDQNVSPEDHDHSDEDVDGDGDVEMGNTIVKAKGIVKARVAASEAKAAAPNPPKQKRTRPFFNPHEDNFDSLRTLGFILLGITDDDRKRQTKYKSSQCWAKGMALHFDYMDLRDVEDLIPPKNWEDLEEDMAKWVEWPSRPANTEKQHLDIRYFNHCKLEGLTICYNLGSGTFNKSPTTAICGFASANHFNYYLDTMGKSFHHVPNFYPLRSSWAELGSSWNFTPGLTTEFSPNSAQLDRTATRTCANIIIAAKIAGPVFSRFKFLENRNKKDKPPLQLQQCLEGLPKYVRHARLLPIIRHVEKNGFPIIYYLRKGDLNPSAPEKEEWDITATLVLAAFNILFYSTTNCQFGGPKRHARVSPTTPKTYLGYTANQWFAAMTILACLNDRRRGLGAIDNNRGAPKVNRDAYFYYVFDLTTGSKMVMAEDEDIVMSNEQMALVRSNAEIKRLVHGMPDKSILDTQYRHGTMIMNGQETQLSNILLNWKKRNNFLAKGLQATTKGMRDLARSHSVSGRKLAEQFVRMPPMDETTLMIILDNARAQYGPRHMSFPRPALVALLSKHIPEANLGNFITEAERISAVATLEKQGIRAEDYDMAMKKIRVSGKEDVESTIRNNQTSLRMTARLNALITDTPPEEPDVIAALDLLGIPKATQEAIDWGIGLRFPGVDSKWHIFLHQLADAYTLHLAVRSAIKGAILAANVGLGKTITVLCNQVMSYRFWLREQEAGRPVSAHASLALLPANLVSQYHSEVRKFFGGLLEVYVFFGSLKSAAGNKAMAEDLIEDTEGLYKMCKRLVARKKDPNVSNPFTTTKYPLGPSCGEKMTF